MKGWQKWSAAAVAVLMLAGCERAARDNDAAVGTSGSAAMTSADRDFVVGMTSGNRAEVELGRLGQTKAASPAVREFAEQLVQDHEKALAEVKSIASKHNLEVADNRDHTDDIERLQKLSGSEFDREFIDVMVDKHQKSIDKLEERANDNENAEIRQWASRMLPTVRQHLEKAKSIKETLKA